jgi:hypothetical protein
MFRLVKASGTLSFYNPEAAKNVCVGKNIGKTLLGNPEAAKILFFWKRHRGGEDLGIPMLFGSAVSSGFLGMGNPDVFCL